MSDSDEEGFKSMPLEIDIRPVLNIAHLKCPSLLQLKPPVSVFYQQPLFQYPANIDDFKFTPPEPITLPANQQRLMGLAKQENNATLLSEYFPRRLVCVYNRFKESTSKRDLTLYICNVSRQLRKDQVALFSSQLPAPPPRKPTALTFSAQFQGGNLHFVFRQPKQALYYLLLQNDVNTHGFNFWFHFKVTARIPGRYTFVVVNLAREVWKLDGEQTLLTYHPETGSYRRIVGFNCIESRFTRCDSARNYWSLQFEYQFRENQQVYISLTYPYSYSKLLRLLRTVPSNHPLVTCVLQLATKSELGNEIPYLKVSNRVNPSKKIILITARQHPSETVGSYICHALIAALLDAANPTSSALLQRFSVCILPMINPDGVIHGNSRTNLLGYDLNRCWTRQALMQSRECQKIWMFIQEIMKHQGKICWSIDLHGHSRELGFFAYFGQRNQRSLMLNQILAASSEYFQEEKSAFEVQYSKRQSIRGQLSQRMRVENAVTIQTSMWGYRDKDGRFRHFQGEHFQNIGNSILQAIVQTENRIQASLLQQQKCEIYRGSCKNIPLQVEQQDILDSDSNPEEDYLLNEERKQVQNFNNIDVSEIQDLSPSTNRKQAMQQQGQSTFYLKKGDGMLRNSRKQAQMMALSRGIPLQKISTSQKRERLKSANRIYAGQKRQSSSHNFLNIRTKIVALPTNTAYSRNQKAQKKHIIHVQPRKQQTQIQYIRKKRSKTEPDNPDIRQSMQMRRRFKMAFQSRSRVGHLKQQGTGSEQEVCELRAIVYPTVSSKNVETKNIFRQKRNRMREIRVSQYGVTVIRKFHDTLYMRNFKIK